MSLSHLSRWFRWRLLLLCPGAAVQHSARSCSQEFLVGQQLNALAFKVVPSDVSEDCEELGVVEETHDAELTWMNHSLTQALTQGITLM